MFSLHEIINLAPHKLIKLSLLFNVLFAHIYLVLHKLPKLIKVYVENLTEWLRFLLDDAVYSAETFVNLSIEQIYQSLDGVSDALHLCFEIFDASQILLKLQLLVTQLSILSFRFNFFALETIHDSVEKCTLHVILCH